MAPNGHTSSDATLRYQLASCERDMTIAGRLEHLVRQPGEVLCPIADKGKRPE
jgi:hypothetical protein